MQTEPDDHSPLAVKSAIEECDELIEIFGREARKHQTLAWTASSVIVLSSASIPVLILISTETGAFAFGKLLPAVLAAVAAMAAGAVQIVRPYDRWRIHRRWQRWLQGERLRYLHGLDEYASNERDRLLLNRVVTVSRSVLEEWETTVSPDTAQALAELPKPPPSA